MQTVDELHHLVHSLTSWEKRAFTMHARRHVKNPQYLRLFMTLDRLKVYDVTVVRKAFKGTLAENNLTELRHALLEELVTCVDRLQTSDDVVARLQHEAEAIEFLAVRGCYATAARRLRRARASARAHELPSALLDLCAVQRRTMPLTPLLIHTLMEDEQCALVMARDHHNAARQLDRWTHCSTSMERFSVTPNEDPSAEPPVHSSPDYVETLNAEPSTLGSLRRLHANILRSSCMRDAEAFIAHALALARMLVEQRTQLVAYKADVNSALIDLADEAALLGITSWLEGLALPDAQPHEHLPRHRVATLMRSAMRSVAEGDLEAAARVTNLVLNDSVLYQAHEAWTAQAILLSVKLNMRDGHNRLLSHIVRSALRTEERRRRFTQEELDFLRAASGSASESRSVRSANKTVLRVRRY